MKKYYTYELVDPRSNKVFYVGKGQNKRLYYHYNRIINGFNLRNRHLGNKLQQLMNENFEPIYRKIIETEIEQEAFDKEIELIAFYGIENLCNLTVGGEGNSNKCSEEIRKKISKALKEKHKDQKFRKKFLKMCKSVERRKKISKNTKIAMQKPEIKKKMIENNLGANNPMYGKTGTNNPNYGQKRKNMTGSKNPMYGKSLFDRWIEKYGLEIAIIKRQNWVNNLKTSHNQKKSYLLL